MSATCIALGAMSLATLSSCRIEPPLRLPDDINASVGFGEVITDIQVIWDMDSSWLDRWWYGWDENDIRRYGPIAYPTPSNYEARFYYFGEEPEQDTWIQLHKHTIYEPTVRRRFEFGYHDVLFWSNIDSDDGTQVLIVDESDQANIVATTTRSRLTYQVPSRAMAIHNNPEIFYSGGLERIYISPFVEDYDYFDELNNVWVKQFNASLYPLVYIYMVQVVVYNNNGRITGLNDNAVVGNVADGVNVRSGHTGTNAVGVNYPMGFKKGMPAREGKPADIFGGKMTTFGLCDMEPWSVSRSRQYSGSRGDLTNHLSLPMHFSNSTDSVYQYDITRQMQSQAHGGLITIEIDADTLRMPNMAGGSMFDPVIQVPDSVAYDFAM